MAVQSLDSIPAPGVPNKFTASENPIVVELKTNRVSDPSVERGYISVGKGPISAADTIDPGDGFYLFGKPFVASNNPASNEFYATTITDGVNPAVTKTTLEIAESVVFALRNDITLSQQYDFWYGYEFTDTNKAYALVYIQAKVATEQLDLETNYVETDTSYGGAFALNASNYLEDYMPDAEEFVQNGQGEYEGDEMTDFGFYIDLYAAPSQYGATTSTSDMYALGFVQQLTIPYNGKSISNIHDIDVSGIIKNYCSSEVQNGKDAWFCENSIVSWGCDYGVYYPQVNNIPRNFYMGRFYDKYTLNSARDKSIANSVATYYNFLYDTSFNKYLEKGEDLVLSLFKPSTSYDKIYIGLDFQDGTYTYDKDSSGIPDYTTLTSYVGLDYEVVGSGLYGYAGVHHIKIRWQFIEDMLASYPDKVLYSMRIVLKEPNISAIKMQTTVYYRLESINKNRLNIAFLNDRGGFENYTFTGEVEVTASRKTNSFLKNQTVNSNIDKITSTRSVDFTKVLKVSSQPLRSEEFNNLIELVKSAQIYIVNDSSEFIFTEVKKVSYSNKSLDDLAVVELEIYDALSENNITQ